MSSRSVGYAKTIKEAREITRSCSGFVPAACPYLQLCQAAALGTHVVGKKGQPTRLRLDRDELLAFLTSDLSSEIERAPEQTLTNLNRPERMRIFKEEDLPAVARTQEAMPIYISTGSNMEMARPRLATSRLQSCASMRREPRILFSPSRKYLSHVVVSRK